MHLAVLVSVMLVLSAYTSLYVSSGDVVVAVTAPYLEPVVRAVGGDRVEVISLVPLGVDPHHYEPPLSTLLDLVSRARLVVMTGPSHLPIEERVEELVSSGYLTLRLVSYRDYLTTGLQLLNNPLTGEVNPHGYAFTLGGLKVVARAVCRALSEVDPDGSEYYERNLGRYLQYLDDLAKVLDQLSRRLGATRVALLTPVLQYVVVELGLELSYLVLPEHGLQVEAPRVLDAANSYGRLYDVLLVSDFELAEYGDAVSQLRSRGIPVAVVPLSKYQDVSPELIPLVTLTALMIRGAHTETAGGGSDYLTFTLIAVAVFISGVALGYTIGVISLGRRR
ncbi:MAG: zinc ABC transporter substrate-binding protein [Desulfurococcaceae archaeon]|nr:zinc ABC transporter substrate-binding protein [Desulfurococcaceae archaeon]